jgi:hypothetical protein
LAMFFPVIIRLLAGSRSEAGIAWRSGRIKSHPLPSINNVSVNDSKAFKAFMGYYL